MSQPDSADVGGSADHRAALAAWDLDERRLADILGHALVAGVDHADLFYEQRRSEVVAVDDGRVRTASTADSQGMGVRVVAGERQGYAHTDVLHLTALEEAVRAARAIAAGSVTQAIADDGAGGRVVALGTPGPNRYPVAHSPMATALDAKIDAMRHLDAYARGLDPRVRQVIGRVAVEEQVVLIVRPDGSFVWDFRPLVRVDCSVIVGRDGKLARGSSRAGGRRDLDALLSVGHLNEMADEAVRQALVNIDAIDVPAGVMDVVLGPGWPAVLLHEAIGHGLEGDFNRKGTSAFAGRLGQQVASDLCTVVDDGTLLGDRGALNVDDEGTPAECTTLIENGRLVGYMQDLHNARLMGQRPTGNGRRESYAHLPLPRMRNTYMRAGQSDPAEILRSVKKGIYAVDFGGGQVDITNGRFVFEMTEAYLIEDGRVGAPLKGATLIGNGPEVLTRVSAVGHDLGFQKAQGVCGKDGQSVPVGVGQPTLRVDGVTVGGSGI